MKAPKFGTAEAIDIQEEPRPLILSCVVALSAMELKLGVLGVLPTKHAKTSTKQKRPLSVLTVLRLTHVYMQVTYAPEEPRLF